MAKAALIIFFIAVASSIFALIYCILVVINSWKLNSYLKKKYKITLNDSQLHYNIFAPLKVIDHLGNEDTLLKSYSYSLDKRMKYFLRYFAASIVLIVLSVGFALTTSTWFK